MSTSIDKHPAFLRALERARHIELRARQLVREQLHGGYRSLFSGRGMDFDEVREYVPGDDVRAIDWNVTARAGHPFIKKYREERDRTVLLAVDISASTDFGSGAVSKRALSAELACVLALAAAQMRDKVGLLLFSDRIERFVPPGSGRAHVLCLVSEVLLAEPGGRQTDLGLALEHLQDAVPRRAAVVVISDLLLNSEASQQRFVRALASCARKHELLTLWILDPRELSLPDLGELTLEDPETGETVVLDTSQRRVRERFEQLALEARVARRRQLLSAGVRMIELPMGSDCWPALAAFLRGGRRP